MKNNPELEAAEKELAEAEQQYRLMVAQDTTVARQKLSLRDQIITLAALVHFLAVFVALYFFVTFSSEVFEQKNAGLFWLWVASLPAAVTSLGIGLALHKVSQLPDPDKTDLQE